MMQQRLNRAPTLPYHLLDSFGDIAADCYAGGGNSRAAVYGSKQDGSVRKAGRNHACEVKKRVDRLNCECRLFYHFVDI
jgi:hypothetical protein